MINEIESEIDNLQKKFFSLHDKGEYTNTSKAELDQLIKPLNKKLKLLKNRNSQYTETEELFTNILGNEGFSFAEVSGVPEVNPETGKVDLTFYIDPQQKTYVRRIDIEGNSRTTDKVIRREMRFSEGDAFSNRKLKMLLSL